jgi:hypothetical protein
MGRETRKQSKDLYRQICPMAAPIFESRYSEVGDQNTPANIVSYPKRNIHYSEINDKIFDIDTAIDIHIDNDNDINV